MAELEHDMDFLGNENRVGNVNLLGAAILEYSLKKNLTAETQMGQINKIILESLLAMRNIIFSQRFYDQVIKVIHVYCGKYVKFKKLWVNKVYSSKVFQKIIFCSNTEYLFFLMYWELLHIRCWIFLFNHFTLNIFLCYWKFFGLDFRS